MDTIFAPITSIISGAIITIRISGENCLDIKSKFNIKKTLKPRFNHLVTLEIEKSLSDQVILSYYNAPNSYTGEDIIEISIHGSKIIYQKIIKSLSEIKNFRFAEAGEFTKRAFINKKLDLVQAEAVDDLIASETELQVSQALKQLYGKNSKIFDKWREDIIKIQSFIEAYIDFPDEDIPSQKVKEAYTLITKINEQIQDILDDNKVGQVIREGIKISIIGPANSGKSSLINNLSGKEIAIVSDIAGTTRDAIETHLNIAGFSVVLTDTAGLRNTDDQVEKIGISKSLEHAKSGDFKILLIPVTNINDHQYKDLIDDNTIIVANKTDLLTENQLNDTKSTNDDIHFISVKKNIGINILVKKIEELIINKYSKRDSIITRERHRSLLHKVNQVIENIDFSDDLEIISEKLRRVSTDLGKIVGNIDIEEILDNIFSSFCIGK